MSEELLSRNQVNRFIRDELDSVPQLEALLLFWRHHPCEWTCEQLARELYVSPETTASILNHLCGRKLIMQTANPSDRYTLHLDTSQKKSMLISLEHTYRHDLIRLSKMIHENASPGMRDFARSFRLKKD